MQIAKWISFSWIVMVDVDSYFGPGRGAERIACSRSFKMRVNVTTHRSLTANLRQTSL